MSIVGNRVPPKQRSSTRTYHDAAWSPSVDAHLSQLNSLLRWYIYNPASLHASAFTLTICIYLPYLYT